MRSRPRWGRRLRRQDGDGNVPAGLLFYGRDVPIHPVQDHPQRVFAGIALAACPGKLGKIGLQGRGRVGLDTRARR